MPFKPLLLAVASIASICMLATSHAQTGSRSFSPAPQPFANCPNCQLRAAASQQAPVMQRALPTTFAPQTYAAPAPIQASRPIQYAPQYSAPRMISYAPAVAVQPVYNSPVYNPPIYQPPVQTYRPVQRSYAPTFHSGCSGY